MDHTHSSIGVRHRHLADGIALQGGVESLRYQDRASNGQVFFALNKWCAAEVCGCSDAFEYGRQRDKGLAGKNLSAVPLSVDGELVLTHL